MQWDYMNQNAFIPKSQVVDLTLGVRRKVAVGDRQSKIHVVLLSRGFWPMTLVPTTEY